MSSGDRTFRRLPRVMGEDEFVKRYGALYEHSPWVAARTWCAGLDESHDTVAGLREALAATVAAASDERKLALINAHPDLAGRAALARELSSASNAEQAGAGIDQCTADELARFTEFNERYKRKFGFVFVMAVKGSNRHEIIAAFESRLDNDRDVEVARALREIDKIAALRLAQIAERCTRGSQRPTGDDTFLDCVDLAQPRLGTQVVFASDDFFADKSRLIAPHAPCFIDGKFDAHGKWMDGWESRRKRGPGYDWCIVRLGVAGIVKGVDIDTTHFTGNFPPGASLDACTCDADVPDYDAPWQEIVAPLDLKGNSHNYESVLCEKEFTHLRLNIFPDGGVARLRVYGEIRPDWAARDAAEQFDLLALENGGRAVLCNDEHYGSMRNLNAPGRGVNMGDGWETARRRVPGNDWVILALGHAGLVERVVIDTAHFKGNYPDKVSLQAACLDAGDDQPTAEQSADWRTLLPAVPLTMDAIHEFEAQLESIGPVTHVRVNIFPDGGLSRLRLFGRLAGR